MVEAGMQDVLLSYALDMGIENVPFLPHQANNRHHTKSSCARCTRYMCYHNSSRVSVYIALKCLMVLTSCL